MDRRDFLKTSGLASLLAVVPSERWAEVMAGSPGSGEPGRFLDAVELDALRAVTDRFLPGPPEDPDPGALQARCAEAIDALLGAFTFDPPLLYAGGPWSNRHGGTVDHMRHFIAPDPFQALGWRIRLEGSQGRKEREFAGPVRGLQPQYRQGLARLEQLARQHGTATSTSTTTSTTSGASGASGASGRGDGTTTSQDRGSGTRIAASGFAALPHPVQDQLLHRAELADFVAQALADTVNAMYGPPEYGGNYQLVGWKATRWPGDVQPRGYTDEEVRQVDRNARRLPYSVSQIHQVATTVLPGLALVTAAASPPTTSTTTTTRSTSADPAAK